MPTKFLNPTVPITTPTGWKRVPNPLYNYTFHPLNVGTDFPAGDGISQYLSTVRYPTSSAPNAQSQNTLVNAQLKANQQSLHDLTYQLLASQPNYAPFSNTAYEDKNGNTYNSLENMHNIVHSLVGNGGHMSYIPYAAFDPIFWLHHANVDRLLAIWQAIYPHSFTSSEVDQYGTYTNKPGVAENINTPLTPFHSDTKGTFYTSVTARSTRSFGYTYPEVVDWGVTAAQLTANVRKAINKLYNPTNAISTRQVAGGSRIARNVQPQDEDDMEKRGLMNTNIAAYQWAINIRSDT
jgi:tyrosinase